MQGKQIRRNYVRPEKETGSSFVATHQKYFTPTLYELLNIAEKRVFEIEGIIKKIKD